MHTQFSIVKKALPHILRRFCFCLLLFAARPASALEIIFSRLSLNDGLSSNFVNCIWQDKTGFIWVGTQDGLQRWDGRKFIQPYGKYGNHSLPALPVHQILNDRKGRMWLRMDHEIGIYDFESSRYQKIEVRSAGDMPENNDYVISTDRRGLVFLVIASAEILVFNPETNAFEHRPDVFDVPLKWRPYSITEDPATGNYWLCTTGGLIYYDYRTKEGFHRGNNPRKIKVLDQPELTNPLSISIDSHNTFWIVNWPSDTYVRLFRFSEREGRISEQKIETSITPGYTEIYGIKESNKLIWAYGANLFNIYDEEEKRFMIFYDQSSLTYGIRFNVIKQVLEDRDHNVWVATDNGLYTSTIITDAIRHGSITGLLDRDIVSINKIRDNRLLFGTWGKRVHAFRMGAGLRLTADSAFTEDMYRGAPAGDDNYNAIWDVCENPVNGHIFLACQMGRLVEYDPVKRRSVFSTPPVFRGWTIRQVDAEPNGTLWFTTQQGLVVKKPLNGDFTAVLDLHSIANMLYIDNKGHVWVGTKGKGMYVIDAHRERMIARYTADGSNGARLSSNLITAACQLNDSLYAIAGSVNLDILNVNTGMVKQLTAYNGLPHRIVTAMRNDPQSGMLWMSTIGGICRYDYRTEQFRSYDQRDGLISTINEKNLLSTGTSFGQYLGFAGGYSFVLFDPLAMRDKVAPKNVTITDLKLFDRYLPLDSIRRAGGLTLRHHENALSIQFASLSFTQRNKLRYFYMLEDDGEGEWIPAENSLTASFSSLPPGDYIFKVKCVNSEGLSPASVTELPIRIRPAYWQTWWFLLLVAIATAVPVFIIYRLRINRLVAVQRLREKVARDLHDDMGSTLTSINILSEMAGMKINGENGMVKDYLHRISHNSTQMMEAMDDIVWSIKPDNDTMPRIVARMREYAATLLEPKDIGYSFTGDEHMGNSTLNMDARRNLFLIFKETLNNIAKHSDATHVSIRFELDHHRLTLTVKDNGRGFSKPASGGNGLQNMEKRALSLRGSFRYRSTPGVGTETVLKVPVT
ncbi:MAG: hypothetical protein INR69_11145 [Mucilaginibacter polytrichastri]|nr:hypothetical protein [Mucilaginibacter polytrichastri]